MRVKVVEELFPPVVRMPLPRVTLPAPAREPIVVLALFRSKVAPEATVTAVGSGRAPVTPIRRVPVLTVVGRERGVGGARGEMAVPTLVKAPVPLITPVKEVEVLSPPEVSVPLPSWTLPAPVSEPIVSLKLLRLRVALAATVTALPSGMTPAARRRSVPALTV